MKKLREQKQDHVFFLHRSDACNFLSFHFFPSYLPPRSSKTKTRKKEFLRNQTSNYQYRARQSTSTRAVWWANLSATPWASRLYSQGSSRNAFSTMPPSSAPRPPYSVLNPYELNPNSASKNTTILCCHEKNRADKIVTNSKYHV